MNHRNAKILVVAPFAGAWIEILTYKNRTREKGVAPFAGAWIEIAIDILADPGTLSLPSRERGLKLISITAGNIIDIVAPFAGAWIEIAHIFPNIAQTA